LHASDAVAAATNATVRAQRLSWAGIKVEGDATTLLIDPWVTPSTWGGAWTRPIVPVVVDTPAHYVLITHAHGDHFDPAALRHLLAERGSVICHEALAPYIASHGFRILSQRLHEPRQLGEFVVTPVPAADGSGEEQVSWVIAGGGRKLFHGGDTMWHGHWWTIGAQHGPFDVAFLPINGAVVKERAPYVDIPVTLTPHQAVAAAEVLRARALVPIHYGVRDSDVYAEQPHVVEQIQKLSRDRGVVVQLLDEGDFVSWPPMIAR
jgi:L-ascorbate metabolism protein UlaG (beta-lactamase superfamily)